MNKVVVVQASSVVVEGETNMKDDPYGARADYEYDQLVEARRLRHVEGECAGVPACEWCLDEQAKKANEND